MPITVRFAPSPTGYLHVGNARVALINWLFARQHSGTFLLRLDDTDKERSKQEYVDGLFEDLAWLGLDPDTFARQSDRIALYQNAQEQLLTTGRLYACYETPEELERKRKVQLARGLPPVYDRSALSATREQIQAWQQEGRKPHWRFLLKDEEVSWEDIIKGKLSFHPTQSLSDPVLIKADGTFLYTLSSVVDDIAFGITHIIRGADHITNTAIQIQLFEALAPAHPSITFAHLALLFDADGQPLSKRINSFCLRTLREAGVEPMALNCMLAGLGATDAPYVTPDLQDLMQHFDLKERKGGARIEEPALAALHRKVLHALPYSVATSRAPGLPFSEKEWEVVREALEHFTDYPYWDSVLHSAQAYARPASTEESAYLKEAAGSLPEDITDNCAWKTWTQTIKKQTGRVGKELAHPLRVALTGRDNGPEMHKLLPLIPREIVLTRLLG